MIEKCSINRILWTVVIPFVSKNEKYIYAYICTENYLNTQNYHYMWKMGMKGEYFYFLLYASLCCFKFWSWVCVTPINLKSYLTIPSILTANAVFFLIHLCICHQGLAFCLTYNKHWSNCWKAFRGKKGFFFPLRKG